MKNIYLFVFIFITTLFVDVYVIMHTDGSGNINHQWSLVSDEFIFGIRACQDAKVVLTSVPGGWFSIMSRCEGTSIEFIIVY